MYPASTTSSTPCSSSHVAITRSRSSRSAWKSRLNVAVGTPAARARTSTWASLRLEATAVTGSPLSRIACRFEPLPEARTPIIDSSNPADGRLAGGRLRDHGAEPDAEVEHAPELLLVDVAREPVEDGRPRPRVPVDLGAAARGEHAREVACYAPAGDVRERLRPPVQRAHLGQIEPCRCQQVVAVVVLLLEDAADEREPVRVNARGREADHGISGFDARAVDQVAALDDADAGAREVEPSVAIDPGQLGRLAADERDTRFAAHGGSSLDELGDVLETDLGRRHVVEEHQRRRAGRDHIVDAMSSEVGAAVAQATALARQDQLRADAVRRGRQQPAVIEGMHAGEGTEASRAGRLDGRAQTLDNRVRGLERDAGLRVALRARHAKRSA